MLNTTAHTIKTSNKESGYLSRNKQFELPSINRTTVRTNPRSTSSSSRTLMTDKIQWITRTVPYENMTDMDVNDEYKRLRDTLKNLNGELAKVLERSQLTTIRSPAKIVEPEHLAEVRDREIDNNKKMISFYRLQYAKLHKRVSEIGQDSKESIEREIIRVRDNITQTVLAIKELRKKSKTIGNNILDGDSLIREMRALEQEKTFMENKKIKVCQELDRVQNDLESYTIKALEISQHYQKAQEVLKGFDQKDSKDRSQKRSEMNLFQKKSLLDATKKKVQSSKSQYQQIYLRKLKDLENNVTRIHQQSNKITQVQSQIMEARITIKELQERLKLKRQQQSERNEAQTIFLTKPIELDFTNYNTHAPSRITDMTNSNHQKTEQLEQIAPLNTNRQKSLEIVNLKTQSNTIDICERKDDISTLSEKKLVVKQKSKKKVIDEIPFNEQSLSQNEEKVAKPEEKLNKQINKVQKQVHEIQVGTEWDQLINDDDDLEPENIPVKPELKPSPQHSPKRIQEDELNLKKKKLLQKLQQYEFDEST